MCVCVGVCVCKYSEPDPKYSNEAIHKKNGWHALQLQFEEHQRQIPHSSVIRQRGCYALPHNDPAHFSHLVFVHPACVCPKVPCWAFPQLVHLVGKTVAFRLYFVKPHMQEVSCQVLVSCAHASASLQRHKPLFFSKKKMRRIFTNADKSCSRSSSKLLPIGMATCQRTA